MLQALKTPALRWLVGIYAAEFLLEFASSVALMVLVYEITDSPVAASLMLVAKQVAPGALAATLGRRLDGVDVRNGLIAAYVLRATVFVMLAFAGTGPVLYLFAFFAGLAGMAARVLIRTTVVRTTTSSAFREVTAAQNLVFGAVALFGPAFGAAVSSLAGPVTSIAAWGGLALALAAIALTMPKSLRPPVEVRATEVDELEVDSAAAPSGLHAPLWSLLVLGAVLTCIFSMDEPALLAYSQDALGGDVGTYGTILTAWGIGMVLGGIGYTRFGVGAPFNAIVVGVLATALGYVGLGVAPSIAVACLAAVLGGAGNGVYWVALVTAVLERAQPGEEAKVSGRLEGMSTAMPAVGFLLGGAFAEYVAPRATLWLPGLVAIVALAAWVVVAQRAARAAAPASTAPSPQSVAFEALA